jgi:drug/metabolite transporter (DMT)-like permease
LISLILAVLSSSAIALLWKIAESKKYSTYRIIQFNYLSATLLSLFFFRHQIVQWKGNLPSITLLAFIFGLLFVGSFFLYATNIANNGAILASSVAKMGILLPVFLSFLIFREPLSHRQSLGLILGCMSLILYFGYSALFSTKSTRVNRSALLLLFFLFISQGLAEMSGKLFETFFDPSLRSLYLGLLFFVSFLVTSYYIVIKKVTIKGNKEIKFGLLLGIPNFFSSYFLIDAFTTLKSAIVFTLFGIGTILTVSLVSIILFKEKITKLQILFLFAIFITIWLIQN